MTPPVKYAKSGDVHIAYQVIGDGPVVGQAFYLEELMSVTPVSATAAKKRSRSQFRRRLARVGRIAARRSHCRS